MSAPIIDDDEFFAYLAIKKIWREKSVENDYSVIFLTDSSNIHYQKNINFVENPNYYGEIRKKESEKFCKAFNIDVLFRCNFPDGDLSLVSENLIRKIVNFYTPKSDAFLIPANNEHSDHDYTTQTLRDLKPYVTYTVHAKDSGGIWGYRPYSKRVFDTLVDAFYFWYPSQKDCYFPSFYSGYPKEYLW